MKSVLVANRGEIARRVIRTCRDLGLSTVAVFSDADADAPHVREADTAVRLPGTAPADTYLRADLIVAAARRAGADAVHPGYGFLSENADFASAVDEAGLVWIGPPADAVRSMGSKIEAKRLMADAGVPVLPELDLRAVRAADLPVLIKASAGGGGRGMRVVQALADLEAQVELARAQARSAFGDPTVFCEPFLAASRHIEVQVMADAHGTVWTVGERECSIQRRHQKVIEESPSPLVERIDGMRDVLFEAARTAAKTIGYTGAGTVEFIADEDGRFYFLEMNTRLQVEHPVTECTTGLDLVALQIAIADGARLDENPVVPQGHSVEARLYAEDPAKDWQPQSGMLHRLHVPATTAEFRSGTEAHGVRVDSGVRDGFQISVHYDPILAKVISWAPTRAHAARLLARALAGAAVHGVATNRDLLVNVLRHKAFLAGDTDTEFFERHPDVFAPLVEDEHVAALAAALAVDAARPKPLDIPSGWRNVVSQPQSITLGAHEVRYRITRDGLDGIDGVELVGATEDEVVLDVGGVRRRYGVARYGNTVYVDTPDGGTRFDIAPRFIDPSEHVAPGSLVAPMPGAVVRIGVAVGDRVVAGQPVLWMEAMKMHHQINAPVDGVVGELSVHVGQQVDVGAVLAVLHEDEQEA
ncbi:MAG TPA: biotin carboxylase N-terminal domain-containing protein [Jatrophihabitantaceae bacterium]